MSKDLPLEIEFSLPGEWKAVSPGHVGASDVAFVAVGPYSASGFTANITIDGESRPDAAGLREIAEDSRELMCKVAEHVVVNNRMDTGTQESPALTQKLTFTTSISGVTHELVQLQVYLSMLDMRDARQRAVIQLALTVTQAEYEEAVVDFQKFIRTVRPSRESRPSNS